MFFLITLLVSGVPLVSAQVCRTIPTPGGTTSPTACVFPFIFENVVYHGCTKAKDPQNKLWCSVKVDRFGKHVLGQKQWGHCSRTCPIHGQPRTPAANSLSIPSSGRKTTPLKLLQATQPPRLPQRIGGISDFKNISLNCQTDSGTDPGKQCQTPFSFKGETFYECTIAGDSEGRPWCSTKVDSRREHIKGFWGYCDCRTADGCPSKFGRPILERGTLRGTDLPYEQDVDFNCGAAKLMNRGFQFIIGGDPTELQEFPFAVLLGADHPEVKPYYFCGGSLINRRYVLTAAHCLTGGIRPSKVLVGDHDIGKDCDCVQVKGDPLCAPLPQLIDVEKEIIHKGYTGPSTRFIHDIALLRLAKHVILNPGVGVVCLPLESSKVFSEYGSQLTGSALKGRDATVVGWGRTEYFSNGQLKSHGAPSSVLQKVTVPIVDDQECSAAFKYPLFEGQICAGALGRDSCGGDSGGPLLLRTGRFAPHATWYLLGVVSYGSSRCGNGKPAVYTRVQYYLPWIRQNLQP